MLKTIKFAFLFLFLLTISLFSFLYYGISAISLAITGSEDPNGLRACVSFVRPEQIPELDKRLTAFVGEIELENDKQAV